MRLITLAAIVALTTLLARPAQADMVDDCVQDRDPDLGIGGCTAAIRSGQWSGKDLAWAYYNRGSTYLELGEHGRAIQDYDQAIRLDPEYVSAYYNRAIAYNKLGKHRRAIEDLDQALRLDPEDADVYFARGRAYGRLDEYRRAIDDYTQSIRLDPEGNAAYINRGGQWLQLGEQERAIEDYDKAVQVGSGNDYMYQVIAQNLSWHSFSLGRALTYIERFLRLDRDLDGDVIDHSVSYYIRGSILAQLGRRKEAMADFERAMAQADAENVRSVQEMLVKKGYLDGAIDGSYGPQTRAALEACVRDECNIYSMATGPGPSIPSEPIVVNQRESLTGEAVRFCYDDAYVRAVIDAGDLLSGSIGDPVSDNEARRYRARLREVDDPDACETPSDRHVTAFLDPNGTSGVPPVIEGKTILETADPAGPNRNCTDPASNGRCRLSVVPHNAFLAYVYSPRLSPQQGGSVVLAYVFTARQIYDPATGRLYGQKMR